MGILDVGNPESIPLRIPRQADFPKEYYSGEGKTLLDLYKNSSTKEERFLATDLIKKYLGKNPHVYEDMNDDQKRHIRHILLGSGWIETPILPKQPVKPPSISSEPDYDQPWYGLMSPETRQRLGELPLGREPSREWIQQHIPRGAGPHWQPFSPELRMLPIWPKGILGEA
jgi:hypothetical protein